MKLSTLFTQYLFKTHRLELSGIGNFSLDYKSLQAKLEHKTKTVLLDCVSFEKNITQFENKELIEFISAKSPKMRTLAASDLESFIQTTKQFLNINNPFTLDDIGTLQKLKSGQYEFTPAVVSSDKARDLLTNGIQAEGEEEISNKPAKEFPKSPSFEVQKIGKNWLKPALAMLILAMVGAGILATYDYLKNTTEQKTTTTNQKPMLANSPDNLPKQNATKPAPPKNIAGQHKYILETSKNPRAGNRFTQLKSYKWDVLMETKDSVSFNLYVLLPQQDTVAVRDSLSKLIGRSVTIAY